MGSPNLSRCLLGQHNVAVREVRYLSISRDSDRRPWPRQETASFALYLKRCFTKASRVQVTPGRPKRAS